MFDLNTLPPLRDVIEEYDLRAKKSLGQNFLLDLNLTQKIVRNADDLSGVTVFEIGPGPGGLTRALLASNAKRVVAVEFDSRAVSALQDLVSLSEQRLEVIEKDALKADLAALSPNGPRAIVANLPYNIATPLLISWLKQIRADQNTYRSMTLMFQKEVADRIMALPNTKSYGRLSVISQWLCHVKKVMDISPSAFTPPPKVTSSVVHFEPKKLTDIEPSFRDVESVTEAAFGQRRKMIRSSLKAYSEKIETLGLDPEQRAENLEVHDFIKLAKD